MRANTLCVFEDCLELGREPAVSSRVLRRQARARVSNNMLGRFQSALRPSLQPATNSRGEESRHIPHEVRRGALAREQGRCTFVSVDGERCEQRGALQFHHKQPYARGGHATLENIALVCGLCRVRHKPHYAACGFMPHTVW